MRAMLSAILFFAIVLFGTATSARSYFTVVGVSKSDPDGLVLRKKADNDSEPAGHVPEGAVVSGVCKHQGVEVWCLIEHEERRGWANRKFLKHAASPDFAENEKLLPPDDPSLIPKVPEEPSSPTTKETSGGETNPGNARVHISCGSNLTGQCKFTRDAQGFSDDPSDKACGSHMESDHGDIYLNSTNGKSISQSSGQAEIEIWLHDVNVHNVDDSARNAKEIWNTPYACINNKCIGYVKLEGGTRTLAAHWELLGGSQISMDFSYIYHKSDGIVAGHLLTLTGVCEVY